MRPFGPPLNRKMLPVFDRDPKNRKKKMNPLYFIIPAVMAVAAIAAIVLMLKGREASEERSGKPASYTATGLLNRSEKVLFHHLDQILSEVFGPHLRIFVQVSYGEFLRGNSPVAYARINQKRADFVIADLEGNVALVIEYQGRGHYGKSERSRDKAKLNDEVKREALASAGIGMLEVPANFDRALILDLLKEKLPRAGSIRRSA